MSLMLGLLADLVLLAHVGFIVFVVVGGFLLLRWPRLVWLHLPSALWGAYVEFTNRLCPLTPLENALRRRAGQAGYEGGFIEHYLVPIVYPMGLDRPQQLLLGTAVVLVNLMAYTLFLRRRNVTSRS